MNDFINNLPPFFRSFWFRWIAVNVIGWIVGLWGGYYWAQFIASLGAFGVIGVPIGGAFTGFIVGLFQMLVIQEKFTLKRDTWLRACAVGGAVGSWLAAQGYNFGVVSGFSNVAIAVVIGAFYAIVLGSAQAWVLWNQFRSAAWILFVLLGGAVCGIFSLPESGYYSVVTMILGPLLFGLVTSIPLARALRQTDDAA